MSHRHFLWQSLLSMSHLNSLKLFEIPCVYKIKYNSGDNVEHHKTRLVVRGDNKKEVIDYNETFALVAKMMNVHNSLLYSDLDKEVYMQLPPSFSCGDSQKVCKLYKSIYGLRHAPQNWFVKLYASKSSKPIGFPLEQNHRLSLANYAILEDPECYYWLVERLIYLTISQLEFSFYVHILSQFIQCNTGSSLFEGQSRPRDLSSL
ncbi:hypothetical protein CR513_54762, partial [Mucuna pruriens]